MGFGKDWMVFRLNWFVVYMVISFGVMKVFRCL